MQKNTQRNRWLRLIFYFLILLFFALLPYEAAADGIFLCPSAALGFQCPGCGVTRAVTLLMKGRFAEAFELNAVFCTVLFPAALGIMGQDVFITLTKRPLSLLEYALGWNGSTPGGR